MGRGRPTTNDHDLIKKVFVSNKNLIISEDNTILESHPRNPAKKVMRNYNIFRTREMAGANSGQVMG